MNSNLWNAYDLFCIFTSFFLPLGGIRLFYLHDESLFAGSYLLFSLLLCSISSILFRFARLSKRAYLNFLFVDVGFALHAYTMNTLILLYQGHMTFDFYLVLFTSFVIFLFAFLYKNIPLLSITFHTLGHLVLLNALLFQQ